MTEMGRGDLEAEAEGWPSSRPARVLIAGGGFAAVESMLALRALAPEHVQVTMVSPSPSFSYRPAATLEVLDETPPLSYELKEITGAAGAMLLRDRLEAVAPQRRRVRLASFMHLEYDALIVAVGARATSVIPGALVFRDQRDVHHVRRLLEELRAGEARRVLFAVPTGRTWPLPLYELALLTATRVGSEIPGLGVAIVSPEGAPLEAFGAEASRLVAGVLAEHGIEFHGGEAPVGVTREGSLSLGSGETLGADRVVCVPQLCGPRITGLPADRQGFFRTNALGGVEDLDRVYAAGDVTSFPVKQGGLATQQADLIAHGIAERCGVPVRAPRVERVLRARLLGGEHPLFLRVKLDEYGQPTAASVQHVEHRTIADPEDAPGKVFARYLTPFLQERALLASSSPHA
jgi:sulfide:quinone oxidoreductase